MSAQNAGGPILICLNLQSARAERASEFYVPRVFDVLPSVQACIGWARRFSLPIIHIHTHGHGAPLPGCEPRPSEPLFFKRERSLFAAPEVQRHFEVFDSACAFVVGFASEVDGLAAACDAERARIDLAFVIDAIASSLKSGHEAVVADSVIASALAVWGRRTCIADLVAMTFSLGSEGKAVGLIDHE